MKRLQIAVYDKDESEPRFRVKIPALVEWLDEGFIPEAVQKRLERQGVSISKLIEKLQSARIPGPLLEVEDQENRIVITLIEEGD